MDAHLSINYMLDLRQSLIHHRCSPKSLIVFHHSLTIHRWSVNLPCRQNGSVETYSSQIAAITSKSLSQQQPKHLAKLTAMVLRFSDVTARQQRWEKRLRDVASVPQVHKYMRYRSGLSNRKRFIIDCRKRNGTWLEHRMKHWIWSFLYVAYDLPRFSGKNQT